MVHLVVWLLCSVCVLHCFAGQPCTTLPRAHAADARGIKIDDYFSCCGTVVMMRVRDCVCVLTPPLHLQLTTPPLMLVPFSHQNAAESTLLVAFRSTVYASFHSRVGMCLEPRNRPILEPHYFMPQPEKKLDHANLFSSVVHLAPRRCRLCGGRRARTLRDFTIFDRHPPVPTYLPTAGRRELVG